MASIVSFTLLYVIVYIISCRLGALMNRRRPLPTIIPWYIAQCICYDPQLVAFDRLHLIVSLRDWPTVSKKYTFGR